MADTVELKDYFDAWSAGHLREHTLLREQVASTRDELSHRLDGMNEFRAQLERAEGNLVRRDEYNRDYGALRDQLTALRDDMVHRLDVINNVTQQFIQREEYQASKDEMDKRMRTLEAASRGFQSEIQSRLGTTKDMISVLLPILALATSVVTIVVLFFHK